MRWMRTARCVLVAVVLVLLAGPAAAKSVEAQLATLQIKQDADEANPVTRIFGELLDSIERKTDGSSSREAIGDLIVFTRDRLAKKGVTDEVLALTGRLEQSMPDSAAPPKRKKGRKAAPLKMNFREVCAMYIVLRTSK